MKTKILVFLISVLSLTLTSFAKNLEKSDAKAEAETCQKVCDKKIMWQEDAEVAIKKAEANKNLVVFYFTGSDWCPYCIKMDEEVLHKPEFIKYANKNLQMILCDFPRDKSKVPEKIAERNASLAKTFQIRGYPTLIVINPAEKTAMVTGYATGLTPEQFIKNLEEFKTKKNTDNKEAQTKDTK